jgi:hypothetical protein
VHHGRDQQLGAVDGRGRLVHEARLHQLPLLHELRALAGVEIPDLELVALVRDGGEVLLRFATAAGLADRAVVLGPEAIL